MDVTGRPRRSNTVSIFTEAVADAAGPLGLWNRALASRGTLPILKLCEAGTGTCDDDNADGFLVTVKLVGNYRADRNHACLTRNGDSYACVWLSGVPIKKLGDIPLILEDPALVDPKDRRLPAKRYIWTDDWALHGQPVALMPEAEWRVIDFTVAHEFGHTLGLSNVPYSNTAYEGIMQNPSYKAIPVISPQDLDGVEDIYEDHETDGSW